METSAVKIMKEFFALLIMATVVQFAAEVFKPGIKRLTVNMNGHKEGTYQTIILAIRLIGGVAISFAIDADIFYLLGLSPESTAVGVVITGVAVAGGSGAVHELLSSLEGMRANIED